MISPSDHDDPPWDPGGEQALSSPGPLVLGDSPAQEVEGHSVQFCVGFLSDFLKKLGFRAPGGFHKNVPATCADVQNSGTPLALFVFSMHFHAFLQ